MNTGCNVNAEAIYPTTDSFNILTTTLSHSLTYSLSLILVTIITVCVTYTFYKNQ